jgi:hypothetical protein
MSSFFFSGMFHPILWGRLSHIGPLKHLSCTALVFVLCETEWRFDFLSLQNCISSLRTSKY